MDTYKLKLGIRHSWDEAQEKLKKETCIGWNEFWVFDLLYANASKEVNEIQIAVYSEEELGFPKSAYEAIDAGTYRGLSLCTAEVGAEYLIQELPLEEKEILYIPSNIGIVSQLYRQPAIHGKAPSIGITHISRLRLGYFKDRSAFWIFQC